MVIKKALISVSLIVERLERKGMVASLRITDLKSLKGEEATKKEKTKT
jgi:hypothetical protein